jgi:hypothetical protein
VLCAAGGLKRDLPLVLRGDDAFVRLLLVLLLLLLLLLLLVADKLRSSCKFARAQRGLTQRSHVSTCSRDYSTDSPLKYTQMLVFEVPP